MTPRRLTIYFSTSFAVAFVVSFVIVWAARQ